MSDRKIPAIIAEDTDIAHWQAWEKMSAKSWAMLEKAEEIKELVWLIEDDDLRGFAYFVLSQAHPTFWSIPSSSSGKYHPDWENGEGGLIRHIKAVMALALTSMRRFGYSHESISDPDENARFRDILAFAVLMHDWGKNGHPANDWGQHTTRTHGEDAAKVILTEMLPKFMKFFPELSNTEELEAMVTEACHAIEHHYGVWSKAKLRPTDPGLSDVARILQEADYYSSRKIFSSVDDNAIKTAYAENSPACMKRISKSK